MFRREYRNPGIHQSRHLCRLLAGQTFVGKMYCMFFIMTHGLASRDWNAFQNRSTAFTSRSGRLVPDSSGPKGVVWTRPKETALVLVTKQCCEFSSQIDRSVLACHVCAFHYTIHTMCIYGLVYVGKMCSWSPYEDSKMHCRAYSFSFVILASDTSDTWYAITCSYHSLCVPICPFKSSINLTSSSVLMLTISCCYFW